MRNNLLRDLLSFLDNDYLRVEPCSDTLAEKIEGLPLPLSLKRLFQSSWPQTPDAMIGPYSMRCTGQILAPDDLERLLPYNMVAVGSAANGDLLVLRFDEVRCTVGLVSHDSYYEESSLPFDSFAAFASSLEEFLYRAAHQMYLPIDYYAARELEELQEEMGVSWNVDDDSDDEE
ncbi:MAG: hypothetical protein KY476_20210 [Planctomycetes bacterium]|nr:hypothetical protein [Planctomycetota bacterium]